VPVRRGGNAQGAALSNRFAQQIDQGVVNAGVRDASRGEKQVHAGVLSPPVRSTAPTAMASLAPQAANHGAMLGMTGVGAGRVLAAIIGLLLPLPQPQGSLTLPRRLRDPRTSVSLGMVE